MNTQLSPVLGSAEKQNLPSVCRLNQLGGELECLDPEGTVSVDTQYFSGGKLVREVGGGQFEMITDPKPNLDELFDVFGDMVEAQPSLQFIPFRNISMEEAAKLWYMDDPRYRVLLQALKGESKQWRRVFDMTRWSALQLNFSGEFDPFGDDGAYLFGMWNHLGSVVAAQIHDDIGSARGHLKIWHGFANEKRFTRHGLWPGNAETMQADFESIPCLIKKVGENEYIPNPKDKEGKCVYQDIHNETDLGVTWYDFRFKRGEFGPYSELRIAPSMRLDQARIHAQHLVDATEAMLEWYHRNGGVAIETLEAAKPAFQYLSQLKLGYDIPNQPLAENEWLRLRNEC